MLNSTKIGVVLAAGGKGTRLNKSYPKQFRLVNGKPLFYLCLEKFATISEISEMVLVLPQEYLEEYAFVMNEFPNLKLVAGGNNRVKSVRFGVEALGQKVKQVLIHDIARPLFSTDLVQNCMIALQKYSAFVTGVLSSDTVKVVDKIKVQETLKREQILLVQTPQCFCVSLLKKCYQNLDLQKIEVSQFTDEASVVEFFGEPVHWVEGSILNRKITYPEDFQWLEQQLRGKNG